MTWTLVAALNAVVISGVLTVSDIMGIIITDLISRCWAGYLVPSCVFLAECVVKSYSSARYLVPLCECLAQFLVINVTYLMSPYNGQDI